MMAGLHDEDTRHAEADTRGRLARLDEAGTGDRGTAGDRVTEYTLVRGPRGGVSESAVLLVFGDSNLDAPEIGLIRAMLIDELFPEVQW